MRDLSKTDILLTSVKEIQVRSTVAIITILTLTVRYETLFTL